MEAEIGDKLPSGAKKVRRTSVAGGCFDFAVDEEEADQESRRLETGSLTWF